MFRSLLSSGRSHTFAGRLARSQEEGYARGEHEAKLFCIATGGSFHPQQAWDWINTAIEDGRAELEAQHASEREVEAWDMSCRIMFLVTLGPFTDRSNGRRPG